MGKLSIKSIFVLCLGLLAPVWASAQVIVPGKVAFVSLDEETAQKFMVIKVEGNIAPPLAEELSDLLSQVPEGRRLILDFDSPGGMNSEGYKMIASIQKARAGRTIDSFIDNGALCASMCIPIYMQGTERIAGARSVFMFHGAAPWFTNKPDYNATKEYTDTLVAAGASEAWIQGLWEQKIFSEPMEYWASGEDLFNETTGIVTKLKSKIIKYELWSAPIDPNIGPH